MCTINEDHGIYGSWNIRCNRQKFLTFWASTLITWKIKILTLKKTPGDIIILHICTTNDNHMMYSSWDMERYRQNILSFWTVFLPFYLWWTEFFVILDHCCPFTLLTTQKIKTLKKSKNQLEILSFYTCVPEMTIIWCMVPEISSMMDRTFLSFWTIFCPFNPLTTLKKNEKNAGDIIILHKCTKNYDQMMYSSWYMVRDRCNCYFTFWAIFCPFTSQTAQKIKIF